MLVLAVVVVLALVCSFSCSISEATLLRVGHSEVHALGDSRAGRILRRFRSEMDVPLAALLILNTVAATVGGTFAGATFVRIYEEGSLWLFSLVFTAVILLFGELLPKTLGVARPNGFLVPVVYWVNALVVLFQPLIFVTQRLVALLRSKSVPATSLEEIRLLAQLGRSEGALGERTASLIEGAARLRELTVYDIMVPRTAVTFLSGTRSLADNLHVVRESGYSRFPYSREGQIDRIEGVILVRDLLFALQGQKSVDYRESQRPAVRESLRPDPSDRATPAAGSGTLDLHSILRPTLFVPESMPLEKLLLNFQEQHAHMAVVVDEYGGTEGIVTLEDVLEEIVGEIEDESDRVDPFIVRRPDESLVCRGLAETRKVFDLLSLEEEEDVDAVSLGGFMAERLGRIPKVGDVLEVEGYRFRVLRASARRAERIKIDRSPMS